MTTSFRNTLIVTVAISVFIFIAFFPSLKAGFVNWDDDTHLYKNSSVHSLDSQNLKRIFIDRVNETYIPLTILSFAIEYHFVKDNPFLYHLNNVLLHILVSLLIFQLLRRLGLSLTGAGIAAVLFGVHPMHVESVAWVTERKDVLYSFFYVAALLSYWQYLASQNSKQQNNHFGYLALSCFFALFSLLAKPMALSLPFIFLLLDWFAGRKITARIFVEKLPIFVITAGIVFYTYALHARMPGTGDVLGSFLVWAWTFIFYLRQFMFPVFLVPIYQLPRPVTVANPEYLLAVLSLILIVAACIRFRRQRWLMFAVLFYVLSNFFLFRFDDRVDANVVADRFMYLSSLGFCALFGYCCERLLNAPSTKFTVHKRALAACVAVLVVLYAFMTHNQTKVWKDSLSLWNHQLHHYPSEPFALNNLATELRDHDRFKLAESQYRELLKFRQSGYGLEKLEGDGDVLKSLGVIQNLYLKAIEVHPAYASAYYNLGTFYKDLGHYKEAIAYYLKTIDIKPDTRDAHFNLGRIFLKFDEYARAVKAFDQTIRLGPNEEHVYQDVIQAYRVGMKGKEANSQINRAIAGTLNQYGSIVHRNSKNAVSYFNLGNLYAEMGDFQRAIEAFNTAISLKPGYVDALYNLGNAYDDAGLHDKSISTFTKVIKIKPQHHLAFINLGVVYSKVKNFPMAKDAFVKAVELAPQNDNAHFNLGYVYEALGEKIAASMAYKEAIRLNPSNSEAFYNLGNVYIALGKNREAWESYERTISLKANHINALANMSILAYRSSDFKNAIRYCDEARIYGYSAPAEYLKVLEQYRNK